MGVGCTPRCTRPPFPYRCTSRSPQRPQFCPRSSNESPRAFRLTTLRSQAGKPGRKLLTHSGASKWIWRPWGESPNAGVTCLRAEPMMPTRRRRPRKWGRQTTHRLEWRVWGGANSASPAVVTRTASPPVRRNLEQHVNAPWRIPAVHAPVPAQRARTSNPKYQRVGDSLVLLQ